MAVCLFLSTNNQHKMVICLYMSGNKHSIRVYGNGLMLSSLVMHTVYTNKFILGQLELRLGRHLAFLVPNLCSYRTAYTIVVHWCCGNTMIITQDLPCITTTMTTVDLRRSVGIERKVYM